MATGVIKFFNEENGYGFIVPDGGGKDVFCHIRDLRETGIPKVAEGQRLIFEIVPGKEGKPRATKIALA